MDRAKKVLEDRARRMATRQGLTLTKNRRRDPLAFDYDTFQLLDHGISVIRESLTLSEVFEALRKTSAVSKALLVATDFTQEALQAGDKAGWRALPPDGRPISLSEMYPRLLRAHAPKAQRLNPIPSSTRAGSAGGTKKERSV